MRKVLDNFEEYILVITLALMTVITVMNVISRKFLDASWAFTEELTTNMFILNTLLGAAVGAKRGTHMGLSVLTDLLPRKFEKYVKLITTIVAVFFCGVLLKYGVDMVMSEIASGQTTPALGWPEWIFGLSIPVGAFLMLVRFIQYGVLGFKKGQKQEEGDN